MNRLNNLLSAREQLGNHDGKEPVMGEGLMDSNCSRGRKHGAALTHVASG
jgi:hypothetical protein